MASTFNLKRKTFSNEEKSTGSKIATGIAGTAATVAAGFYGARKGMFGNKVAMGANKMWGKAGKAIGNDYMKINAASDYGKARANQLSKNLINRYGKDSASQYNSKEFIKRAQSKFEDKGLKMFE